MVYAGFWWRVAAFLIDYVPILMVVVVVFSYLPSYDQVGQERNDHPDDLRAQDRYFLMRAAVRWTTLLIWLTLCTVLEPTRLHGSPGKFLLHLKVLDEQRQAVTFKRALIRNATKIMSVLALYVGFLWVAFTDRKQGWHDILADTVVVRDRDGD